MRLYEVTHDENDSIVTDIKIATNSQNSVDLRDLRANEEIQKVGINGQKRLLAVRNYERIAADLAHQLNIL